MGCKYVKEFTFSNGGSESSKFVKGYYRGGKVAKAEGGDVAQDKAMIKAAVHKHEKAQHPGKPLTKLAAGGMATGRQTAMPMQAAQGTVQRSLAMGGSATPPTQAAAGLARRPAAPALPAQAAAPARRLAKGGAAVPGAMKMPQGAKSMPAMKPDAPAAKPVKVAEGMRDPSVMRAAPRAARKSVPVAPASPLLAMKNGGTAKMRKC